jgi:hypothetical protein
VKGNCVKVKIYENPCAQGMENEDTGLEKSTSKVNSSAYQRYYAVG